ncbi:hypothetical protein BEP19_07410 [Ammoniphilus oxalaticus]|uniref:Uncharacterized protein n=1 Tax=Ammoniphilus oxalaticus TaxID=66863 RepID=A0A419SJK6_9BACL|nr:hypothetical protein BEP19_07410 [Ammoniphilus oxalaticus]
MEYKTCLRKNIQLKTHDIKGKFGDNICIKLSSSGRRKVNSNTEIKTLIKLKKSGSTDKAIAQQLNQTYWSVVYKLRELRKTEFL